MKKKPQKLVGRTGCGSCQQHHHRCCWGLTSGSRPEAQASHQKKKSPSTTRRKLPHGYMISAVVRWTTNSSHVCWPHRQPRSCPREGQRPSGSLCALPTVALPLFHSHNKHQVIPCSDGSLDETDGRTEETNRPHETPTYSIPG